MRCCSEIGGYRKPLEFRKPSGNIPDILRGETYPTESVKNILHIKHIVIKHYFWLVSNLYAMCAWHWHWKISLPARKNIISDTFIILFVMFVYMWMILVFFGVKITSRGFLRCSVNDKDLSRNMFFCINKQCNGFLSIVVWHIIVFSDTDKSVWWINLGLLLKDLFWTLRYTLSVKSTLFLCKRFTFYLV